VDKKLHEKHVNQVKKNILDDTSNWSAKIAITGTILAGRCVSGGIP